MNSFLQQLINGFMLGSVYALIAIGYTMVYGIIKLINFAHCDVFMVSLYTGYFAVNTLKLTFLPAMIFTMAICAALGMLIEYVAYKPLRNSAKEILLVTTIGVELLIQNTIKLKPPLPFGPNPLNFPEAITLVTYELGPVRVSNIQIITCLVTIGMCIILQFLIAKTNTGRAMRATSNDRDAAALMGINISKIISITFAIGSALAATGGILFGMLYPKIDPVMGVMPGLKAFVAAVLGGIGIIPGAMLGGILIGLIETLSKVYISSSFSDAIAFSILILVLLVKPSGLLGKKNVIKV